MNPARASMTVAAALLFVSSVSAQYGIGAVGLHWNGSTSQGGTFCWGFSCTPDPVTVLPGETVVLTVRGEWNQPYVLAFSLGPDRCLAVPGLLNSLVLGDPINLLFSGSLSQPSPILACPPGYDTLSITFPLSTPPGLAFTLQALAGSFGLQGPQFAFTTALSVTVL